MKSKLQHHPASLPVFFTTEMWERYGFYVVQTLLALFLAFHFKWDDASVYALVGSFTALTYISPILGGWIADRLLGQKQAIIWGGVVLFASYMALSLTHSTRQLIICLAGIAVGTGLFKPNISSLLGNTYAENSPKREAGFTIFFMGITTGIILGTTVPNVLHYYYGWPVSFVSAAIGMFVGLVIFVYGSYRYDIVDYVSHSFDVKKVILAVCLLCMLLGGSFCILDYPAIASSIFLIIAALTVLYFMYCARNEERAQARRTVMMGVLCIISMIFWAFYFQMFLSLTLFISRQVTPTLWGIQFPAPYYVSIQSLGTIVFGLFISRRAAQNDLKQCRFQTSRKFFRAMLFMSAAYALIMLICYTPQKSISPFYIIPAYLCISIAELYLYPVGLSAVTVLASPKKVSTFMGIFFVSLGLGGFLSGKLAVITALPAHALSEAVIRAHYTAAFTKLFVILIGVTMVCYILTGVMRRLISEEMQSV